MTKSVQKWIPDVSAISGPKYLAIQTALARAIETGLLEPGDRLPPQRELARALGVDLTTVTRAYSEAQRLGLIDAQGRRGSFVLPPVGTLAIDQVPPTETGMNLPPLPMGSSLGWKYIEGIQTILAGSTAANRLQYQPSGGAYADRKAAAQWLETRHIEASPDMVLIASGAQNALHAIAAVLFREGDAICTGGFVYPGWIAIARQMRLRLIPIASDADGLDPAALASVCQQEAVRGLYVVPNNDNPTTATIGEERRRELADVARSYNLKIVEDDAYGPLKSAPPLAIASIAPERTWYVASLSKIISPAMRVAYLRAPTLSDAWQLVGDIHQTSIMAPPLNAALATHWLGDGSWDKLVTEVRQECVARQVIVTNILKRRGYSADPEGYHLWIPLAPDSSFEMLEGLRREGLSVVSSEAFTPCPSPDRAIRVSIGGGQDREQLSRSLSYLDALLEFGGKVRPTI